MLSLNNPRNFAEDEQDFSYIVAYHETPDTQLERTETVELAEELHNHVQAYLKDQFKSWFKDTLKEVTEERSKDFSEFCLDCIDLSEGE